MTKEIIFSLISCSKTITGKPRKSMYKDKRSNFTLRNDFSCASIDGEKKFEIFMRINTEMPTIFSIGLQYQTESGYVTICRYNGKHMHKNKVDDSDEFNNYHIHTLFDHQLTDDTEDSIDAIQTDKYISFDEALFAFLTDCGIDDWQTHFPELESKINQLKIEGV